MAITPQAAANAMTVKELEFVDACEKHIDHVLSKEWKAGSMSSVSVKYSDLRGGPSDVNRIDPLNPKVVAEIIRRYEAAGWTCKSDSSMSGGQFFSFYAKE